MISLINPFDEKTDPNFHRVVNELFYLKTKVDDRLKKANAIEGIEDAQFKPLTPCVITLPYVTTVRENRSQNHYYSNPLSLEALEVKIREIIATARAEIDRVKALNAPIIEHNDKIEYIIKTFLERVGIPSSYTTFELPTPRSRYKKTITHSAGYLADIGRARHGDYSKSTQNAEANLKQYEHNFEAYIKREKDQEVQDALKRDAEIVELYINKTPKLFKLFADSAGIDLAVTLSLAPVGTKKAKLDELFDTAIQTVTSKNKYLALAVALEANRYDNNDGPRIAQAALNRFIDESDTTNPGDLLIISNLQEVIKSWDGDGRVFRDAAWGYSTLYDMVDKILLQQFIELRELRALL